MMVQEINLPFDVDLPPVKAVNAGALAAMYEAGNLRYIRLGNTEVVRKIYGAVRNEHWDTISCEITGEEVVLHPSGFSIRYTAIYGKDFPLYRADFLIEGRGDNSIVFSMKGEALAAFQRNRIGLCVNHPIKECQGKEVIVTQPDGESYTASFPARISPHQPFLHITQMEWTGDNVRVQLLFTGDVFETEDQRNWSDASYKTYSTPQSIPIPVAVQPGDKMEQVITLRVSGTIGHETAATPAVREEAVPFPQIGYAASGGAGQLIQAEVERLSRIPFDHYRVTIVMKEPGWLPDLQTALAEAGLVHTRLELVVFFSGNFENELDELLPELKEKHQLLRSILVLHEKQAVTPADVLRHAYPRIKKELTGLAVGYGTNSVFADLNRNRPQEVPFDFISFSLHPQVHAVDSRSVLENLENQADLIKTAEEFAAGKPVFVSPVTWKDRQNLSSDERHYSWMAACWTLITLQNCSAAASITFYELFGPAGLLPLNHYATGNSKASPVYEMLSTIHQFNPARIIKRWQGDHLIMDGLLLENEDGERLFFRAPPEITRFTFTTS